MPGSNTVAGVFNLRPATTYHLRIVAENEIGESEPSDTVTIITAEEGYFLTFQSHDNLSLIISFSYNKATRIVASEE